MSASPARPRQWFAWTLLFGVALSATALVASAIFLRSYADRRIEISDRIGEFETAATKQAGIVWRAVTLQLAEEQSAFHRLRGEEQRGRTELYERLEELRQLDANDAELTARLGFDSQAVTLDELELALGGFMGGVQSVFGQLSLNNPRVRQRLEHWDLDYGPFEEALEQLETGHREVAAASAGIAGKTTGAAVLMSFLTAALFVWRLGRLRARRASEIEAERVRTLAEDEARFRELVAHSSDLTVLFDPDGTLAYASPSAARLANGRATTVQGLFGLEPSALMKPGGLELELLSKDGQRRVFEASGRDLTDHPSLKGLVLNARDITERQKLELKLRHQALHDPLTNLPNRRQFQTAFDELDDEIRAKAVVLFVDLDGFKRVNDSYGHATGDRLLIATAARLAGCLGAQDLLARQGGDEFLILSHGDGLVLAERLLEALAAPFPIEDRPVFVTASIGVADQLIELDSFEAARRADIAMYAAKQAGKAQALRFEEAMLAGAPKRLALESDFRQALAERQFQVYYQPKVGFTSNRIESLEALVRWIHPERGFVGPDLFIPFAEESGLICELGAQVFEQACLDALRWQDRGIVTAINLSPLQFRNPEFLAEIEAILKRTGVNPKLIELEITESAVLGDLNSTIEMFTQLKSMGLRLAIDDFGTGYSNLAHLKHFDVDVLKIDQAFVRGGNPSQMDQLSDRTIVEAVISMAKAFGMHVVAEGVESASHVSELRELGADLGQGYFFSKPVTGEAIDELLANEDPEERRAA